MAGQEQLQLLLGIRIAARQRRLVGRRALRRRPRSRPGQRRRRQLDGDVRHGLAVAVAVAIAGVVAVAGIDGCQFGAQARQGRVGFDVRAVDRQHWLPTSPASVTAAMRRQ